MYITVSIVNHIALYIWKLLKRVDLKSSYHKKKIATIYGGECYLDIAMIIVQYTQILNYYVVHLKKCNIIC